MLKEETIGTCCIKIINQIRLSQGGRSSAGAWGSSVLRFDFTTWFAVLSSALRLPPLFYAAYHMFSTESIRLLDAHLNEAETHIKISFYLFKLLVQSAVVSAQFTDLPECQQPRLEILNTPTFDLILVVVVIAVHYVVDDAISQHFTGRVQPICVVVLVLFHGCHCCCCCCGCSCGWRRRHIRHFWFSPYSMILFLITLRAIIFVVVFLRRRRKRFIAAK